MSTALKVYNGIAVFILGGKNGKFFFVICILAFQQNKILFIMEADFFFIGTE